MPINYLSYDEYLQQSSPSRAFYHLKDTFRVPISVGYTLKEDSYLCGIRGFMQAYATEVEEGKLAFGNSMRRFRPGRCPNDSEV
jgi:hypothetical protein